MTTKPVEMTRSEAESFMTMLNQAREAAVFQLQAIERKRWRDSEKAMAGVKYNYTIDQALKLQEKIGTIFNLGGY